MSALEATEEERQRAYEAKWAEGGSISFLYSYTDLLVNKESNDTASEFVCRKIRATVKDPKTAELLCPNNHPIGTKRLILDTDYYETYNRDNVTLVGIRSKPIQEVTPTGLRTANAEFRAPFCAKKLISWWSLNIPHLIAERQANSGSTPRRDVSYGPVGQVAQSALTDLAAFAVALAQEDRRG